MDNLHDDHQTVLAGDSQEREGRETRACMMAPERDLGLNPPSSQRPHCQTLQEQKLQEQKLHSRTLSPFAVMPSGLLTESTEPVEGNKGSLDQSRSMDQEEKRDVPMHLPRSQEVLPFGITKKESLEERPLVLVSLVVSFADALSLAPQYANTWRIP